MAAPTTTPILTLPTALANFTPLLEADATVNRVITMNFAPGNADLRGPFLLNNRAFMHDYINDTVQLDAIEIWEINSNTSIAHPFHIHDVQFRILTINGQPPAPELAGFNDVVLVRGGFAQVRFIAQFSDFASDTVPYMYHCHMLPHEDMGMMGQFIVTETPVGISEIDDSFKNIVIYPNPTSGEINISGLAQIKTINLFSIDGQLILTKTIKNTVSKTIEMPAAKGTFLLEIINKTGGKTVRKVIHY